jgi:hypothetical protein
MSLIDEKKILILLEGTARRISKAGAKRMVIGGYASVLLEDSEGVEQSDLEGDSIVMTALKESFPRMMSVHSRRNIMAWHSNTQIGEIIEEFTDADGKIWKSHVVMVPTKQYPKKGLWILGEIFDDLVEARRYRRTIEKGDTLSYSIGGEAIKTIRVCNGSVCTDKITVIDLHEVSVCQKGINPESKFRIMKGTISHPALLESDTGDELLRFLRK